MKSTSTDDPKMDTRVLMPAEFSLVVTARPLPPLDRLVPAEDCIKVCATRRLPAQTRYLPFSGTVRADNLPLLPYLPPMDVSTSCPVGRPPGSPSGKVVLMLGLLVRESWRAKVCVLRSSTSSKFVFLGVLVEFLEI